MHLPIRLIPHRQIDPSLLIHDTLVVRECVETDLSVISAHTAFAEAAESHFRGGQMDDRVIDASAAEAAARGHLLCRCIVGSEEVKSQRMRHGIDVSDHFIQAVEYKDRHDGTEDLFLHDSVGEGYIVQDSGLDAECLTV